MQAYAEISRNMHQKICINMPKYSIEKIYQIFKYMQNLAAEVELTPHQMPHQNAMICNNMHIR